MTGELTASRTSVHASWMGMLSGTRTCVVAFEASQTPSPPGLKLTSSG